MRSILILLALVLPSLAVMGVNNIQTQAGALSSKSQKMIETNAKDVREVLEKKILPSVKKRYEAKMQRYLLVRKLKELKKRRLVTRKNTALELEKMKKIACERLNVRIARLDRKINDYIVRKLLEAWSYNIIPLKKIGFYYRILRGFGN